MSDKPSRGTPGTYPPFSKGKNSKRKVYTIEYWTHQCHFKMDNDKILNATAASGQLYTKHPSLSQAWETHKCLLKYNSYFINIYCMHKPKPEWRDEIHMQSDTESCALAICFCFFHLRVYSRVCGTNKSQTVYCILAF